MIAKSGARLLKPDAIEALKAKLLPLATVVTPNLHEAAALTGREITTLEQMRAAARAIREMGPENVVVKGGHLESIAADVLYDGRDFYRVPRRAHQHQKHARERLYLCLGDCSQFSRKENTSRKRGCRKGFHHSGHPYWPGHWQRLWTGQSDGLALPKAGVTR